MCTMNRVHDYQIYLSCGRSYTYFRVREKRGAVTFKEVFHFHLTYLLCVINFIQWEGLFFAMYALESAFEFTEGFYKVICIYRVIFIFKLKLIIEQLSTHFICNFKNSLNLLRRTNFKNCWSNCIHLNIKFASLNSIMKLLKGR